MKSLINQKNPKLTQMIRQGISHFKMAVSPYRLHRLRMPHKDLYRFFSSLVLGSPVSDHELYLLNKKKYIHTQFILDK